MKKKSTGFDIKENNCESRHKKRPYFLCGVLAGLLGGLLGSGGGTVTALWLRQREDWEESQRLTATVCTILPSVGVALLLYSLRQPTLPALALPLLPAAALGGGSGALLQAKLSGRWLRLLFSAMLTIGGGLLLVK